MGGRLMGGLYGARATHRNVRSNRTRPIMPVPRDGTSAKGLAEWQGVPTTIGITGEISEPCQYIS